MRCPKLIRERVWDIVRQRHLNVLYSQLPLPIMVRSAIPPYILKHLARIEPGAQFTGALPQVLSSSGRSYYAKIGSPTDIGPYATEAESLRSLGFAAPGLVPALLAFGFVDENGRDADGGKGSPFFITEYKVMTSLTERSGAILGRRLATEVHNYTSSKGFGSEVAPYYGGATRLRHGWFKTWERYVDAMIGDLLSTLESRGGYSDLCRKGQDVRARVIPALLRPLRIKPVLLHGGLWSGGAGTDATTGEPVVFDASCVYGHHEADLAAPRMFEGMPQSFFDSYHNHMPITEPVGQYELRGDLYELFHHLNHTVLFGEQYASGAQRKMDKLLRALA
ncbi:Fructosamine/Ketosamine-3-kinase [Russula earlei]|uniref:Fructosamine/Ketosamine-3-kinase n=1 Tax=Russula earlei TaxID=71964 RepID=A0ACC0ULD0_9AGAM|nr:Fructosamine/Ketosamine-3-kinase [Russula earlei]